MDKIAKTFITLNYAGGPQSTAKSSFKSALLEPISSPRLIPLLRSSELNWLLQIGGPSHSRSLRFINILASPRHAYIVTQQYACQDQFDLIVGKVAARTRMGAITPD